MTRPLPLLVAAFLTIGCGGSVESKSHPTNDAGTEAAPPDAGSDVQQDAPLPPPPDAAPDAVPDSGPEPGLGSACDGQNGNPSSCQSGLTCYTGQGNPNEQGRWPGGYCTLNCHSDSTCAPFGGVCAGASFGGGKCLQPCTKPTDCRQGYACRDAGFQSSQMVCTPTGFIATRGAGVACFQHNDPSAQYYTPPLDDTTFTTSQQVDTTAISSDEVAFAMNSANQVVVGANAITQYSYSFMNPAMYATGSSLPLSFATNSGPQYGSAGGYSDPYIVAASDGTFYYSTLGLNNSSTAYLVVGHSTDGGKSWQSVKADPDSDCAGSLAGQQGQPCLDHPWLAVGPDKLNPSQDAVYAAYLATRSSTSSPTVLIRSTDGGKTWGIPGSPNTSLAVFDDANYYSNLITPTVDSTGVVHMVSTWISLTFNTPDPQHGSTGNAIMYSRSEDGGKTRTDPVEVNTPGVPVPFEQAAIATDNGNIYVAYVSGKDTGDWDIVLASSTDDAQTWNHQTVNDNPSGCATNFHPAIAVDHTTHKVYVAWYDGRFAPYEGNIALTVCTPAASGDATCTPNVAINAKPFYITTDRNDLTFIGDYFTLHVKPGGEVWAGYGDTELNGISHAFLATGTP